MVNLTAMYPAQANSPATTLSAAINSSATSITVSNGSIIPVAPTWLTIGADSEDAETVLLTAKSGNNLTVVREQQGTVAKAWAAGTTVQRCFTAADHDVLIDNIDAINTGKAESAHTHTKASITDFPSTMQPTAHKSSHSTGGSDALTPADIGAEAEGAAASAVSAHNSSGSAHSSQFESKLDKSGGTMTGALVGQTNTNYATAQVRNAIISTTDLESGVSALANGTLYFVYE